MRIREWLTRLIVKSQQTQHEDQRRAPAANDSDVL
jgi:hypothetical protein